MPPTESKVRNGKLTLDGVDFSCQPTNVRIVPGHDESGDDLEVLCGDALGKDITRSNTLAMTAIQDFTDAAGLVRFSWANDVTWVPFSWQPTADVAQVWTGEVEVRALEVGGEVNRRLTNDAEWKARAIVAPDYVPAGP